MGIGTTKEKLKKALTTTALILGSKRPGAIKTEDMKNPSGVQQDLKGITEYFYAIAKSLQDIRTHAKSAKWKDIERGARNCHVYVKTKYEEFLNEIKKPNINTDRAFLCLKEAADQTQRLCLDSLSPHIAETNQIEKINKYLNDYALKNFPNSIAEYNSKHPTAPPPPEYYNPFQ